MKKFIQPPNIHIILIPVGLKTYNVHRIYMAFQQISNRKKQPHYKEETP